MLRKLLDRLETSCSVNIASGSSNVIIKNVFFENLSLVS